MSAFLVSPICATFSPSHIPWFDRSNNMWGQSRSCYQLTCWLVDSATNNTSNVMMSDSYSAQCRPIVYRFSRFKISWLRRVTFEI
jgi:hypothetical protein